MTGRYTHTERDKYSRVMKILKKYSMLTPRELVIARLASEFRDPLGRVEMTWIGENIHNMVPFFVDPLSRQNVAVSLSRFRKKIARAGVTMFFPVLAGLLTEKELKEILEDTVEGIKTLLEIEKGDSPDEEEIINKVAEIFRIINERLSEI